VFGHLSEIGQLTSAQHRNAGMFVITAMALYKRGKTWHTDFSVNGQRFRQSLDTTDWPRGSDIGK
jgi:hypothetical protein